VDISWIFCLDSTYISDHATNHLDTVLVFNSNVDAGYYVILNPMLAQPMLQISALERGRKVEELQKRLVESEMLRTRYNRKVTVLKDQVI
jgi:hypothetical protein